MLICETTKHILIIVIDYNVELQTSLQHFSSFTNELKQCVNSLVASIWKCKYIEWKCFLYLQLALSLLVWSLDFIGFIKSIA